MSKNRNGNNKPHMHYLMSNLIFDHKKEVSNKLTSFLYHIKMFKGFNYCIFFFDSTFRHFMIF